MCSYTCPSSNPFGRSLNLFLVEGSPRGIITAEIGKWSGKAVVAPRTALPKLFKRKESARTGVYLLKGPDIDTGSRMQIYAGESENITARLAKHDSDVAMEFYTHVCWIVSKDDGLTKAHVRYLEARIIEKIKAASRAILLNSTNPDSKGLLPEAAEADMETFLSEIEVLLPVLGYDVFPEKNGIYDSWPESYFSEARKFPRKPPGGGEDPEPAPVSPDLPKPPRTSGGIRKMTTESTS